MSTQPTPPHDRIRAATQDVIANGQPRTIHVYGTDVTIRRADTIKDAGRMYPRIRWRTHDRDRRMVVRQMSIRDVIRDVVRSLHPDVSTWPEWLDQDEDEDEE